MKIFFRNIHLYLGLAAGLFISIACLTGAILVFEEELQHLFHHNRYYNNEQAKARPIEELKATVLAAVPNSRIGGVKIYGDPTRNYEFTVNVKSGGKENVGNVKNVKNVKAPEGIRLVAFVNPYSGEIVEVYNHRSSFFYKVMDLHRWLLAKDTGKLIMGISTLIFLFIIMTGIVLWWPKNKAILKQRLNLKFDAGWKRVNHDLHIVLGFYSAIILFVFAFTALAWSFQWFNDGIYTLTNSPKKPAPAPESVIEVASGKATVDQIYAAGQREVHNNVFLNIGFPADSAAVFTMTALRADAIHETATDTYYFDQYSGGLTKKIRFEDKSLGQRVRSSFKPIHTSSIFGLPGKIIGFIVCLLGFSFPITGTIMWINRISKKKKLSTQAVTSLSPLKTGSTFAESGVRQ